MNVDVFFAGLAVGDFGVAQSWYERLFARPPDVVAHASEVMWQVTAHSWLYIVQDPDRAGSGVVAMAVPDLEAAISTVAARGIGSGPIERQGEGARKSVTRDPDGNSIALIEVSPG